MTAAQLLDLTVRECLVAPLLRERRDLRDRGEDLLPLPAVGVSIVEKPMCHEKPEGHLLVEVYDPLM